MWSPESQEFLVYSPYMVWPTIGIIFYFALRKPEYLLSIYCSAYPFLNIVKFRSVSLLHVIPIFLLIGVCLVVFKKKKAIFSLLMLKPNIILILFCALLYSSVYEISSDIGQGEIYLKYLFYFCLVPYLCLQILGSIPEQFRGFVFGFIVTSLVLSIFVYIMVDPTTLMASGRLYFIVDPITFSIPLSISCIFVAYCLTETRNRVYRSLMWFVLGFLIFTVFLTGTRQSFYPSILIVGLCLYLLDGRALKIYILFFILVFLVLQTNSSFLDLNNYSGSKERLFRAISNFGDELAPRMMFHDMALSDFMSSPLLGNGLGSFGIYRLSRDGIHYFKDTAHNLYLGILVDVGLIGFSLFAYWLYLVFRCSIKLKRDGSKSQRALGTAFFCVLLLTIFQNMASGALDGGSGQIFWSAGAIIILGANSVSGRSKVSSMVSYRSPVYRD